MPASQMEIVTTLQEKIDRVAGESSEESPSEKETSDEKVEDDSDDDEKEKSKHLETRKIGVIPEEGVWSSQTWRGLLYSSRDLS